MILALVMPRSGPSNVACHNYEMQKRSKKGIAKKTSFRVKKYNEKRKDVRTLWCNKVLSCVYI